MTDYDVIILGGGPAGLSAGMYLSRAKQRVLILDKGSAGGQVLLTHAVANYPGLPELSGYQLASAMKKQARDFGCAILSSTVVERIDLKPGIKTVTTEEDSFTARAVILAMGGSPRPLGLESETRLRGKGISYCATCDGDFFTGRDILVVGGGNSALEEAVSLTAYARRVTVVHQFDHFQAYEHAVREAKANNKIDFIMESTVAEFLGQQSLEGAVIRHLPSGREHRLDVTGAFIFIGYVPETELVKNCVVLNDRGEILSDEAMATSVPGVFAAGDARAKRYRQITTAVGDGTVAALSALEYLQRAD